MKSPEIRSIIRSTQSQDSETSTLTYVTSGTSSTRHSIHSSSPSPYSTMKDSPVQSYNSSTSRQGGIQQLASQNIVKKVRPSSSKN